MQNTLTKSQKIFVAELVGTFGLLVSATGSIVYDGSLGGVLGISFISAIHFVGIFLLIILFGKYSMAHFNPAVTIGFFIAKYITAKQIILYVSAQAIGAFLGTMFVKYVFGDYAKLGLNSPNHAYPVGFFFGVETIATIFLMGAILLAINIKRLSPMFVSAIIAGTVSLDVFFLGSISGASMNPIRSLTPAVFTGVLNDLWIYWSAPFIGVSIVGIIYKKRFAK
ncbi:MAG: aquaporin [Nitrososphaerota archaeon]|nr:aquaporin [Nitrososphaerota archaeon]